MAAGLSNHAGAGHGWTERLRAFKGVPQLLAMVWKADRFLTVCVLLLRAVSALIPMAILAIGKYIVDIVVRSGALHRMTGAGTRMRHGDAIWWLVASEGALALLAIVLQRLTDLADSLLGDRFAQEINVELVSHATTLDLESFERPEFADTLARARRQAGERVGILISLGAMLRRAITLLTMIAVAAWFLPLLLIVLCIAAAPLLVAETRFAWLTHSLLFGQTPERRHLDYIRYLGSSAQTAKEVRGFGLGEHLRRRMIEIFEPLYASNRALALRRTGVGALLSTIPIGVYYAAYAVVVAKALAGSITVGDLVLVAGALGRARAEVQALMGGLAGLSESAAHLKDLFDYFDEKPTIVSPLNARPFPATVRSGFAFENVSFAYPGSPPDRGPGLGAGALANLSFEFRPGESLALVGVNGAGKTTVTKLLLRLYDPGSGRVTLDGVDLREYDLAELRRRTGVLFQDYVRYDLAVTDNVGFGDIERVDEPEPIMAAARASLAHELIAGFPNGYAQVLGRRFEGGIGLSVGQWQRIALARAYMRNAQVVILDEPCSNLDPHAEFEVYRAFLEHARGRMSLIISHRFSAVRLAQRILVLDRGRLAEEGSHAELVARGGRYAEMFETQAAAYR